LIVAPRAVAQLTPNPKPPRDVGATNLHARKAPSPVIGSLIDLPGHAAVGIKIVFASIILVHPPAQICLRLFACSSLAPRCGVCRQLGEVLGLAALANVGVSPRGSSTSYCCD